MNSIRIWIRNAFGFSGNEINGFLVLIPLMIVLLASEPAYRAWIAAQNDAREVPDRRALDSLISLWHAVDHETPGSIRPGMAPFDPNTASVDELRQVGVPEILSKRIAAYRRNGGVFRTKADLLKIYDFDSSLYQQFYDYIALPEETGPDRVASSRPRISLRAAGREKTPQENFDINTADTTTLKSIYGIGSVLAARIVKFRDALGGFVHAGQLYEVYGLDSLVVGRLLDAGFIAPDFTPRRINVNDADEKALAAHPYIDYRMAAAIVNYRFQHGDFTDAGDIKKLSVWKAGEAERLLPYIKTAD